jgi:hypothetical protein
VPLIDIRSVVKHYGGLRPFRLRELSVESGDLVVIGGPDEQAAAIFTDLLTGTTLPDEGEILVAGRSTASLRTPDDWLAFLDRFGLVSARAVLLDQLTVAQNLAIAQTLDVDPMSAEASETASRLAAEVGFDAPALDAPALGGLRADAPSRPPRTRAGARSGGPRDRAPHSRPRARRGRRSRRPHQATRRGPASRGDRRDRRPRSAPRVGHPRADLAPGDGRARSGGAMATVASTVLRKWRRGSAIHAMMVTAGKGWVGATRPSVR